MERKKKTKRFDAVTPPSNQSIKSIAEIQRCGEERDYQRKQLTQGRIMIWITGGATVTGFISLYFLYATLAQNLATLKIQQRAYLSVVSEGPEFVYGLKPDVPIRVNIRYKNTGPLPATGVRTTHGISVGPNALAQVQKVAPSEVGRSLGVLVPSGVGVTTTNQVNGLTADQLATFMKGETIQNNIQIVVWGSIFYRDIFHDSHETEFCFRFLTGGLWSYCPSHNRIE